MEWAVWGNARVLKMRENLGSVTDTLCPNARLSPGRTGMGEGRLVFLMCEGLFHSSYILAINHVSNGIRLNQMS